MQIRLSFAALASVVLLYTHPLQADDPWFTGPLLAPAGVVIPLGHVNLEPYVSYVKNIGTYNRHGKLVHTLSSQTTQIDPIITYGLSDKMDFQFSVPYAINRSKNITGEYIGDVDAILGFQALTQENSLWRPNLRITLQETFPTGRYKNLSPGGHGVDGTGMGSYQTSLALNFQHQLSLWQEHYLCSLLSLNYTLPSTANLQGLSTYGGTSTTKGRINPGQLVSIDLAGQLSVTQHWVAVMEAYYFLREKTHFKGYPGESSTQLGSPSSAELSLAPAIEYNFSENYGIIAGVWFAVQGKSTSDFISPVIAFNAYW